MTKVSPLIVKNESFLQKICSSRRKRSQQQQFIRDTTDEQLLCLVEICTNILKGRVPPRKKHLKKLQHHAHVLRRLARTRCSRSAKRVLLQHPQQEGKGLPAIAGLLTSIVMPIITNALMHK